MDRSHFRGARNPAPPRTPNRTRIATLLVMGVASLSAVAGFGLTSLGTTAKAAATQHAHINCASKSTLCTEVVDSEQVFGQGVYVGHDEPANLFYSNQAGAGNQMQYQLWLPSDPATTSTPGAASYNFQLHPAFWFGMAMCDTQSYPEQVTGCTPDSDSNIVDPAKSAEHPGTAFMEMQFYPPGWVPFNLPGGISCSAREWCAALNIDSLSENPVTGQVLNTTCQAHTGVEYVNFAYITKNGVPQAPPNPVDATATTFTADPTKDLFMNSGDHILVTMHDTSAGLRIDIADTSTGQAGFMTSSAANGFGQVKFAPKGTSCTNIPYNFHPMYSTSSEQTRVPWAAHTYNIAFSDEIGHFDFCHEATSTLGCEDTEGAKGNQEPTDADDTFCQPASAALRVHVTGCANSNVPGFDGTSYLADWPDGAANHPTPVMFTSPLTGADYNKQYSRSAFETDLPRVELGLHGCDPFHDTGCTLLPITDDGHAAPFYPFYSTTAAGPNGSCAWMLGSVVPGLSVDSFNGNQQYGTYDSGVMYTGAGGIPFNKSDDFRNILSANVCPAA